MKHGSELLLQEMKTYSSCGFYLYNILLASLPESCLFAFLLEQVPASPSLLRSAFMSKRNPAVLLPWLPSCWSFLFISSPHLAFDSVSPV